MKPIMISLFIIILNVSTFATSYTITSGYFETKTFKNSDTLIMTGGGGDSILGKDNCVLDIKNTSSPYVSGVSGLGHINMDDNSRLYFSGGSLRSLDIVDDAFAVLSGGQIGKIVTYYPISDQKHITIYCQPGWTYQNYEFSGRWLDDTPFNIELASQYTSNVFDNITVIPEPATMLLLGMGGLWLRTHKQ
ncbi:MAG: PEP-CTERM sorting domain-containing protein [Anaerohalosphaeraceae bacterium]